MRSHDEIASSDNPGIFGGLVNLVASLECVLEEHLKTATVFKGTSETVQNELLDCVLSVLRDCFLEDLKTADYLAIQADETTDTATHCQRVHVLRYIDSLNKVQQCFYAFIKLPNVTADIVATAVLERLKTILPEVQRGGV